MSDKRERLCLREPMVPITRSVNTLALPDDVIRDRFKRRHIHSAESAVADLECALRELVHEADWQRFN